MNSAPIDEEEMQRYLEAKMKPQFYEQPEAIMDSAEAIRGSQETANLANMAKGFEQASASFSGGRYKPNTEYLDDFGKTAQGMAGNAEKRLAFGQQQAGQDRKAAVNEYLAGKKQEKDDKFRQTAQDSTVKHQRFMEEQSAANAAAQQDFRGRELDLRTQLAESKVAGAVAKQPHEQQKMLDELSTTAAKRASVSNLLEERLIRYRAAVDAGNQDEATKEGQQMLKLLNSPDNPDAVGSEEAKRLGSFLEKKVFNMLQPGSMFGQDLDQFDTQVANSVNIIRDSAKSNLSQVEQLKAGKGLNLKQVEVLPKPSEDGTATAAPAKTGMVKLQSPDGKEVMFVPESSKQKYLDRGAKIIP